MPDPVVAPAAPPVTPPPTAPAASFQSSTPPPVIPAPPVTPPPAAPPASPGTVLTPAPVAPVAPAAPPVTPTQVAERFYDKLPEKWREDIAQGMSLEPGQVNMLGRFNTFPDLIKSYFHAQERIRQRDEAPALPTNATEVQIAEYRTKLGIPATPAEYKVALDPGLVLSDEDTRIMGEVYKVAHAHYIKPDVVSRLTNAMLTAREAETAAALAKQGVEQQTATSILRDTWKNDFQTNLNIVAGLVNKLPESVREAFSEATLADGRKVFNSPEVLVWLCDLGREANPAATVLLNTNNPMATIDIELSALKTRMRDDPTWHSDKAANDRYMQLIEAKEKMSRR